MYHAKRSRVSAGSAVGCFACFSPAIGGPQLVVWENTDVAKTNGEGNVRQSGQRTSRRLTKKAKI